MTVLSFAYRFLTNFALLATVYLSLSYTEKYNNRAILAIAFLVYAGMRAVSALRTFYFFQRIERLEIEARRLAGLVGEGPSAAASASASRKQIIASVSELRHSGEMKAYIDLLFLALVILLCIAKIVTN